MVSKIKLDLFKLKSKEDLAKELQEILKANFK